MTSFKNKKPKLLNSSVFTTLSHHQRSWCCFVAASFWSKTNCYQCECSL